MKLLPSALTLSLLALVGCGRGEDGDRESTAASAQLNDETLAEAEAEAAHLLGPRGTKARAVWDHLPSAATWSRKVLARIHEKPSAFEIARDLDDFCPGFASATRAQKDTCWLRLVSAMARYESNFRPNETYREHTGSTSVGLLMMNPAHCADAPTIEKLKDPAKNIDCAMNRMGLLVSRDRYISGPANERGAGAYWSVLRPRYSFRNLWLGKKLHIQKFTRSYLAYSPAR